LAAVQRCNSYALREFTPLLVGDEQVGWLNPTVLEVHLPIPLPHTHPPTVNMKLHLPGITKFSLPQALTTQLAVGRACEHVEASMLRSEAAAAAAGQCENGFAVRIAPGASGAKERSEFAAALVEESPQTTGGRFGAP